MAVIPMQKIAVLAHKDRAEDLIQFLQEEGAMEVSEAREITSAIDHSEVNFRIAELEYAISTLKNVATKQQLAAMANAESTATPQQVQYAVTHIDVRGIIDELHQLDAEDQKLQKMLHSPVGMPIGTHTSSEQAAYFTESGSTSVKTSGSPSTPDTEKMETAKAEKKIADHAARRSALAEDLAGLALVRRYIKWLNGKQAAREAMKTTKMTVMLLGWIPANIFAPFEKKLLKSIDSSAVLRVKPDAGEEPPVYLKNSTAITPFESVTTLYGLPLYKEMDPTPYLAFFFILFFALCLTDAGYGAVLALISGGYLWKTKIKVKDNPLIWLLFLSGIITVIVSIPFGGWFGMVPDKAPEFLTKPDPDGTGRLFKGQIWNLSDQSGITFLQNLSLALGIIHLSFGIFLGAISKIRGGSLAEGLWKDGTTLAFIGATLLYFLGPVAYKEMFLYSIYASLILMVWGKGHGNPGIKRPLFGILQTLNFFLGMMGNVLSYLRILALGLVTGALAFTVNLVAEQVSILLPIYVAIPVAIIIYVVGHLMNIALNVLGAFIHSGRLQFVEFFSQFFEGGGRPFRPFVRQ